MNPWDNPRVRDQGGNWTRGALWCEGRTANQQAAFASHHLSQFSFPVSVPTGTCVCARDVTRRTSVATDPVSSRADARLRKLAVDSFLFAALSLSRALSSLTRTNGLCCVLDFKDFFLCRTHYLLSLTPTDYAVY